MTLVHCCRCGLLYEESDTVGMVMEQHFPKGDGFIGGICGCEFTGKTFRIADSRKKMWYVDWIVKREKENEK